MLPRSGKQPPMMKPRATAIARTSPQGRSIEFQKTNFRLTMLAFWTDIRAISAIQVAAIVEIIRFVIALVLPYTVTKDCLSQCGHPFADFR